ncbi:MAG: glycosyl hydrolase family 8 [Chitinivibrionales bacterium]
MAKVISFFCRALLPCMLLLPDLASADDTLWNLPYARPSKYNYTAYYSADVNASLAASNPGPGYFKQRFTSGWNYYKANFIMSSGLVNQMAGNGVGTTTAVSEGQGYGMLLALLNNDQTTFNRIFQAANTYMWSSSHNSYFNWKIVNGGVSATGAATDAELDICLALIFADKLQKNSSITKWQAFNSGGVTYASRATQMLQSIHTNMTQNNYLLPGDNWAGSGLSNMDPSYFATGYMRVFDQYQTAYAFTPVASTCFTVLKSRSAQYAKGQAPDWCTSTGGQAGNPQSGQTYQGLGMTDDAIRTPWRICMDALWFNTADAITFCSNSRNTLTQYVNVTPTNEQVLLQQMGEYTNTQSVIDTSAGAFHFIAMWLCGALGSKDASYSKQCLNATIITKVAGTSVFFGDIRLSDEYYYYNQSLGMLGFAAFTGMFPNVLADTIKAYVNTKDVSQKIARVSSFHARALPGGIGFSLGENYPAGQHITVALYDLKGKRALSQSVETGSLLFMPVAKDRLSAGIYILKASVPEASGKTMEYLDRIDWK